VRDEDLAKRLGISTSKVKAKRQDEKIVSVVPAHRKWTAAEERLLGTLPDEVLAARLKRTRLAVLIHRQKLRIPAAKRHKIGSRSQA